MQPASCFEAPRAFHFAAKLQIIGGAHLHSGWGTCVGVPRARHKTEAGSPRTSAICCGVPPPPDFMPEIPGIRHRKPELSNQELMKRGFLGKCMFGMSLLSTQCELHPGGRVLAEGFGKRASPCCSSHPVPPMRLLPRESRDTPKVICCLRSPSKRTSQAFSESTWTRQASPAWFLDTSSTSQLPVSYLHLTCLVRARILSISVLPPGSV